MYEGKTCFKCKEWKDYTHFHSNPITKDKLASWCKECMRYLHKNRSQYPKRQHKQVSPGDIFTSLTVLRESSPHRFECRCKCGNVCIVSRTNLHTGHKKSCGCLQKEDTKKRLTTHGQTGTPLFKTWMRMKARCYSPSHNSYKNYGGRGIEICPKWKDDFQSFVYWAVAAGYKPELSIERINVNGNYEPANCRWATLKEQKNNTRRTHRIQAFGETKTITEWSKDDRCKANLNTLYYRMKTGWDAESAISSPPFTPRN